MAYLTFGSEAKLFAAICCRCLNLLAFQLFDRNPYRSAASSVLKAMLCGDFHESQLVKSGEAENIDASGGAVAAFLDSRNLLHEGLMVLLFEHGSYNSVCKASIFSPIYLLRALFAYQSSPSWAELNLAQTMLIRRKSSVEVVGCCPCVPSCCLILAFLLETSRTCGYLWHAQC